MKTFKPNFLKFKTANLADWNKSKSLHFLKSYAVPFVAGVVTSSALTFTYSKISHNYLASRPDISIFQSSDFASTSELENGEMRAGRIVKKTDDKKTYLDAEGKKVTVTTPVSESVEMTGNGRIKKDGHVYQLKFEKTKLKEEGGTAEVEATKVTMTLAEGTNGCGTCVFEPVTVPVAFNNDTQNLQKIRDALMTSIVTPDERAEVSIAGADRPARTEVTETQVARGSRRKPTVLVREDLIESAAAACTDDEWQYGEDLKGRDYKSELDCHADQLVQMAKSGDLDNTRQAGKTLNKYYQDYLKDAYIEDLNFTSAVDAEGNVQLGAVNMDAYMDSYDSMMRLYALPKDSGLEIKRDSLSIMREGFRVRGEIAQAMLNSNDPILQAQGQAELNLAFPTRRETRIPGIYRYDNGLKDAYDRISNNLLSTEGVSRDRKLRTQYEILAREGVLNPVSKMLAELRKNKDYNIPDQLDSIVTIGDSSALDSAECLKDEECKRKLIEIRSNPDIMRKAMDPNLVNTPSQIQRQALDSKPVTTTRSAGLFGLADARKATTGSGQMLSPAGRGTPSRRN